MPCYRWYGIIMGVSFAFSMATIYFVGFSNLLRDLSPARS